MSLDTEALGGGQTRAS